MLTEAEKTEVVECVRKRIAEEFALADTDAIFELPREPPSKRGRTVLGTASYAKYSFKTRVKADELSHYNAMTPSV